MNNFIPSANNKIELSGIIASCTTADTGEKTEAIITVCTGNLNKGHLTDEMFHKVHLTTDGITADKLKECEKNCQNRIEKKTESFDFIQVTGEIRHKNNNTDLYIEADNTTFETKPFYNHMSLQGTVKGTTCNDAYAKLLIETKDSNDNITEIPVTIPKESKQYKNIYNKKVKEGTNLSMEGALISMTFKNENNIKIYHCSLNTYSYKTLRITKKKNEIMKI